MSDETFEPKQIRRTDSGSVIVFDPVNRTLTTAKLKGLDANQVNQATKKTVPKWSSRVRIYEESGSNRMIATLNLDKLDWWANVKRHVGLISEIYVMEMPTSRLAVA